MTEFEPAPVSLVITEIAVPATSHATDRHSTSTITAPTTATSGDLRGGYAAMPELHRYPVEDGRHVGRSR